MLNKFMRCRLIDVALNLNVLPIKYIFLDFIIRYGVLTFYNTLLQILGILKSNLKFSIMKKGWGKGRAKSRTHPRKKGRISKSRDK